MTRLIFFILALGFFIQSTGNTDYFKKSVNKTEQYPDGNQQGEENNKEDYKKDNDKLGINLINEQSPGRKVYTLPEFSQDYPSGFYNKPYLPPR